MGTLFILRISFNFHESLQVQSLQLQCSYFKELRGTVQHYIVSIHHSSQLLYTVNPFFNVAMRNTNLNLFFQHTSTNLVLVFQHPITYIAPHFTLHASFQLYHSLSSETSTPIISLSLESWRLLPQLPVFPISPKHLLCVESVLFRIFTLGCHEKHRLYQRKVTNGSMDTSFCISSHNIITFSSMIACGGVRGSATSELGKQRNVRGDSSTDVQTGEDFANMIGKVQQEDFVAGCKHAVEYL